MNIKNDSHEHDHSHGGDCSHVHEHCHMDGHNHTHDQDNALGHEKGKDEKTLKILLKHWIRVWERWRLRSILKKQLSLWNRQMKCCKKRKNICSAVYNNSICKYQVKE